MNLAKQCHHYRRNELENVASDTVEHVHAVAGSDSTSCCTT
jgi:hypothetical protein